MLFFNINIVLTDSEADRTYGNKNGAVIFHAGAPLRWAYARPNGIKINGR